MRRPGSTASGTQGFSLIEIIVVIAVISILASMAVPYAAKFIDQAREDRTRQEMKAIYEAVVGDPATQRSGYVGDMGTLPLTAAGAPDLVRLVTQGGQAGTGVTLGVKHGWNGPYLNVALSPAGAVADAWGTPYVMTTAGAGALQPLQFTSYGPDRAAGGGDDIVYPANPSNPKGSLLVNLYVWDGAGNQYVSNPQPPSAGGGGGGAAAPAAAGGNGGTAPGNSGNAPGQGGTPPGRGGAPPGQAGGGGGGGGGGGAASGGYSGLTGWVRLHYADGTGADRFDQLDIPPAGPYAFGILPNGYPAGLHAIEAQVQLGPSYPVVAGQATVYIGPNSQSAISLYLR